MKRLNIIIIALFCSIYMAAQGLVKGHVADKQTDERLQFVNVTVTNAATGKMVKGAITDAEGSFKIDGLADGKYNLTVAAFVTVTFTNCSLSSVCLSATCPFTNPCAAMYMLQNNAIMIILSLLITII